MFPREDAGEFKSRIRPPYPQRVVILRRLNGAVCRNHRIKRMVMCRWRATLKNLAKCLWRWEPDRTEVQLLLQSACTSMCRHIYDWNIVACDFKKHQYTKTQLNVNVMYDLEKHESGRGWVSEVNIKKQNTFCHSCYVDPCVSFHNPCFSYMYILTCIYRGRIWYHWCGPSSISSNKLKISSNIWRYLKMNWRYLQMNWGYLQMN